MKGSIHLATVTGIPVKIHWTFGLLLLYVAFDTGFGLQNPWYAIFYSIAVVLGVFFCVILHEFGHALAARRYGVRTHDILMTPIGGIARLERMPEGRLQEFWVAIAGPMVNFLIVGLIWLGFLVFQGRKLPFLNSDFWVFENQPPSYFMILLLANAYLGLFNLLPAFPMDGGRILRSLLSVSLPRDRATQIAAYIGQALAFLLFSLGVWRAQPTLTLIGVFIFFAARQEYRVLARQTRLQKTRASDLMQPVEHLLHVGQSVAQARSALEGRSGKGFIVWSRPGIPAGYVMRDRLIGAVPPLPPESPIDPWVIPSPVAVAPDVSAGNLYQVMRQHQLPVALVSDGLGYVGTVPWEAVDALLQ